MSEEDNSWKDNLPDELKDRSLVREASSLESFVKQAINAESLLGVSVRIPSEHASDDDRAAFTEKMGKHGLIPREGAEEHLRPSEPAHYKLAETPTDADAIGLQQTDIDQLKIQAYEMGMSPKQFASYSKRYIDNRREQAEERRIRHMQANEDLQREWGPDAFDHKRTQALMAVRRFGGPDLARKLDENPDPDYLRAFADIGKRFEEQGLGDLETPKYLPESRDEAQLKLQEILNNPEHPFNKRGFGPGAQAAHEAAAAEVMRLRRISMGKPGRQEDYMFSRG